MLGPEVLLRGDFDSVDKELRDLPWSHASEATHSQTPAHHTLLAPTKAASQHCPHGPENHLLVNLMVPEQSLACNLQLSVLGLTVGL